jgi:hypothetical protein
MILMWRDSATGLFHEGEAQHVAIRSNVDVEVTESHDLETMEKLLSKVVVKVGDMLIYVEGDRVSVAGGEPAFCGPVYFKPRDR